ncbi:uroporphyrinogen-III synthase [Sphingomonas sp. Root50]|uniref:uroporphyrinogen-III synthase n=2 Tax=Sphingomonas TaxID=13687 RepID=UPI0009E82542|nr:uroporphyrinogen-III synthase [Sphingomonas sp. Root50]
MAIGMQCAPKPEPRRIWVTRTGPHNRLTARRLQAAGWEPIVQPVMTVSPIVNCAPMAVPDALVFTSLQGVRLHPFFPSLAKLPVFAVGDRTARFARIRGYSNVLSASGDVHDLRALINHHMPARSEILHISALQPAGDLLGMLRRDGFLARRRCVYQTIDAPVIDLEWAVGALPDISHILIHSPRAGLRVATILRKEYHMWHGTIACISPAAARPFSKLPVTTTIANAPTEAALLRTLPGRPIHG